MLPIPFGNPHTYTHRPHSGVDFPQPRGTIFRASGPGRVASKGHGLRSGYTVWVQYDNGVRVGYVHMDAPTTLVNVGDRVVEGTPLGRIGSKGLNSTGPHLHAEVSGHATTAGFWKFFDRNRVVGSSVSGGTPTVTPEPEPPTASPEEDDMFSDEDRALLKETLTEIRNTKAGVWTGGVSNGKTFKYGVLPIVAHNQTLIAQQSARISALSAAVSALASSKGVDPAALLKVVEAGVKEAMRNVSFTADVDG